MLSFVLSPPLKPKAFSYLAFSCNGRVLMDLQVI